MSGFGKAITALLGIVAVLACLTTVGIIGYTAIKGGFDEQPATVADNQQQLPPDEVVTVSPVPTGEPTADPHAFYVPTVIDPNHVHNYSEKVLKTATCTEAGQIKYTCNCGDSYCVDILAKGHVPDEWEIAKEPTDTEDGYKVKKCIYCDEILAKETLPAKNKGGSGKLNEDGTVHEHLYVSTVEREATCTLAGLRLHKCSCGDFYTESIPALGHVAADWEENEAATTSSSGTATKVCVVCGQVLDVKSVPALSPSPSASASPSAAATGSSASSSPAATDAKTSPSPSPTPHVHNYQTYVVTPATCTEKGVRSYVCSCGSSYSETIDLDLNNHKFMATFVAPTETQQGYTIYTCLRCNYSYKDNYIMPLSNAATTEGTDEADNNKTN